MNTVNQIPYEYSNLPIPGGGYVTGFLFHPQKEGLLYLRTDIGGSYRYDPLKKTWKSLISHVTMEDLSETYPISIAVDEAHPERFYVACGMNRPESGVLAVSDDYGKHFTYEKIPVFIHGNLGGRGTGERLIVDRQNSNRLYFASQRDGLWVSEDRGHIWSRLAAMEETHLTFVKQLVLEAGTLLIVGSAGVKCQTTVKRNIERNTANKSEARSELLSEPLLEEAMCGSALYVSADGGQTFERMQQPESAVIEGCRFHGLVAQRCSEDDRYFYVTFASTGRRSYLLEDGYSCDSGDSIDGHLVRYEKKKNALGIMEEITPVISSAVSASESTGIDCKMMLTQAIDGTKHLDCGLSGISASRQTPGMLVVTTIVKDNGDAIFRSMDYGNSWECILYDLEKNAIRFRAPYMKPEYNGGKSLIHWLSDFKINPFDDNEGWFNTGTGVFVSHNLKQKDCFFTDWCDGIEETVHLNVYSLPSGPVKVLDIVGDLGGFAFEDTARPCENSFADENGNRYITCINADFQDENPAHVVVTPRGNWTGKTKGGLILSEDYGKHFTRVAMPYGLSEKLDKTLAQIETPNVNSGWVAMSADGNHIVWSIAKGIELLISQVIVSHDGAKNFSRCEIYDAAGQRLDHTGEADKRRMKVVADRTDSSVFYGFGEHSRIYISHDAGQHFYECAQTKEWLPDVEFGLIDCANKTQIQAESGKRGVLYLAIGEAGLWRMQVNERSEMDGMIQQTEPNKLSMQPVFTRLSAPGDAVYRLGLGVGKDGDYRNGRKVLYCNARIAGSYGFYRMFLDEQSQINRIERLNTENQMYGEINAMAGDCREYGVFYLATGSNGLIVGRQAKEEREEDT